MNDKFKFRAWNKKGKFFLIHDKKEKTVSLHIFEDIVKDAEYIILQCTGLCDKNGKLIFDGDIVEVQYLGPQISLFKNEYSKHPENERFEVFCDEDWLKFYAKNDHYRKTCEIHSFDLEKIRTNTYNKVYEVIGNIYENPELLEVVSNV